MRHRSYLWKYLIREALDLETSSPGKEDRGNVLKWKQWWSENLHTNGWSPLNLIWFWNVSQPVIYFTRKGVWGPGATAWPQRKDLLTLTFEGVLQWKTLVPDWSVKPTSWQTLFMYTELLISFLVPHFKIWRARNKIQKFQKTLESYSDLLEIKNRKKILNSEEQKKKKSSKKRKKTHTGRNSAYFTASESINWSNHFRKQFGII